MVDYAETRADQVAALLPLLAATATTDRPVRILLLVRAAPTRSRDWADALRGTGDPLDTLVDDVEVDLLDEVPLTEAGRVELFRAAAQAFARRAGDVTAVAESPTDLADPTFSTPLLVVIRAYLEVHGGTRGSPTRSKLLDELLEHEDHHWARTVARLRRGGHPASPGSGRGDAGGGGR